MAFSLSFSSRALGRLTAGAALVVAALVVSVAVAPSAWAGHSEVTGVVGCTEEGAMILDWEWAAYRHMDMPPPQGTAWIQYGDPDPIGVPRQVEIGTWPLPDLTTVISESTLLDPPEGATQVRITVSATWHPDFSDGEIGWLMYTTDWIALPQACEEPPPTTTTTTAPPTTTTEATTSTTTPAGVTPTSAVTSSTTAPVGVLSGGASGAAAQVVPAQAAPAQTLPNTGSSSGVLAAAAVLLIAVGGGLVATTRRHKPAGLGTEGSTELG
jgi:LPXTG-motif cell wall-anchored protein